VILSKRAPRGGTEIFVYTKDQPSLFAKVVGELDRRNLNVHDAQIMTSKDGYVLDTFMVLDQNGSVIEEARHQALSKHIVNVLKSESALELKTRRLPRQLKHFTVKTKIDFLPTRSKKRTLMEFVALDTPGLLATVGATFSELNLDLHAAKITTMGERAEDLFILTSPQGNKLSEEEEAMLRERLIENVSELAPD
jgi:[protein-PII] uridylyltransferase